MLNQESSLSYKNINFWQWIENHLHDDPSRLRLAGFSDENIDASDAITQIECRRRFGKKLGETLQEFGQFYFPSKLAGEQSTSDRLARWHTGYVSIDDTMVDLTAGLGIDVMHLARKVRHATAVERNPTLAAAMEYNAEGLKVGDKLSVMCGDCTKLIDKLKGTVAFIDPARRADDGSRVNGFSDCEPDVKTLIPKISENFDRLIIKASPMLDITEIIKELYDISDIYVVGTTTECKEIDVILNFRVSVASVPKIHAVTLFSQSYSTGDAADVFEFTQNMENEATAIVSKAMPHAGDKLFVPYPATMKAAPVKLLSAQFGINKFHDNTHLYFGTKAVDNFPGETLNIIDVIPWQSKNIKRLKSQYPNASVSVRNFGMTADALSKKLGIREGGTRRLRLFGIGLGNSHTDRILVITE